MDVLDFIFLKYWLNRSKECNFSIEYINDDSLSLDRVHEIITSDKYVSFRKFKVYASESLLTIVEPNGTKYEIVFTNQEQKNIPWIGKPEIFFECTGKFTASDKCKKYLKENTKMVLISATSWDSDGTFVYGYNHNDIPTSARIISYGSCTVNAYVPFANWINKRYKITNSDVNVIHNIQEYRVKDNYTLTRKFCTLEKSALNLLSFHNEDNFLVNYTVIPYTGISMIDFRFSVSESLKLNAFIDDLDNEIKNGSLKDLDKLDEKDVGPEIYNCTPYSTVFIKEGIKIKDGQIYLQGYFDNENSVNRFYDLANFVSEKI